MGSGRSGRPLSETTLSLVSLEKYHRPGGAVPSLSLPLDILNSVPHQSDWGVGEGGVQESDRDKGPCISIICDPGSTGPSPEALENLETLPQE